MATVNLTEGAIDKITRGGGAMAELKPVLQITELKQVQPKQPRNHDLFRLALSNGSQLHQAILCFQINHLVKDGNLRSGSVVQLMQYTCATVSNLMIIIILDMVVILDECALIGNPVSTRSNLTNPMSAWNSIQGNMLPKVKKSNQLDQVVTGLNLTEGAIDKITRGGATLELKPVLQITELKQVQPKQPRNHDLFRLALSDGSQLHQAILCFQVNHLVKDGNLRSGSVVQLMQYTCATVRDIMLNGRAPTYLLLFFPAVMI